MIVKLVCMIGKFLPVIPDFCGKLEIARISIPIAILIWVMIYPMMLKVDFQSVKQVGKNPKGLFVTRIVNWLAKPFTKIGRESQETFCNYRTMMSNFVEMLYRQLLVVCLCPCVLYDILFISTKNIYSYSQLKEGTYAYGTASVKNI